MDSSDEPVYSLTARSEREAVRGITVGAVKVSPDSITRLDPVVEDRLRSRLKWSLWGLSLSGAIVGILALRRASFLKAENARQNQPVGQDNHWPFTDGSSASTKDIRKLLVGDLGCVYTIPLGTLDRKDKTNPLPGESLFDYQRELGLLKMTTRDIRNATRVVDVESILSLHRKSTFWLEPRFITPTSVAMPAETLLVLGKDFADDKMYRLIMALIMEEDDGFTSVSLQSNPQEENRIVVTSETGGTVAIYAGIGDDPYALLAEGAAMASQLATSSYTDKALYLSSSPLAFQNKFHLLSRLPDFARYLGWCTWNAFYTKYDGAAILSGVDELHSAKVPIRWMILDDGWQHTTNDTAVQQKLSLRRLQRLAKLDSSPSKFGPDSGVTTATGNKKQKQQQLVSLNETIRQLKLSRDKGGKGLDYVLAWHAISGYWLGLDKIAKPAGNPLELPNVSLYFPQFSAGLMESTTTSNETQKDPSIKLGIGIPENATDFYSRYYAYMRQVGIDGVKVDDQAILGSLRPFPSVVPADAQYKHRHQVITRMHQALSVSAETSFHYHANALPIIHCMSHAPEILYRIPSLYGSSLDRPLPLLRASEDYFPNIPSSHGPMIAAATFNSLLLGQLSVPDWDQFQTIVADTDFAPGRVVAKFHAAARSISGGPIYISDVPGSVNSTVLESVVCIDGSVLPCAGVGLPTRTSLLRDPLMKGSGPMVIWNTNGIPGSFPSSGVLGIFQAGESSGKMTVVDAHPRDIEPFAGPLHEEASFVGLSYNTQEMWLLEGARASMPITVPGENLWSDVVTIVPLTQVRAGDKTWEIAPVGYIGMFNGAGAILKSQVTTYAGKERFLMSIRGCGDFAAVVRMRSSNHTIETPAVSFTVRIDAATFTRGAVPFGGNVPFHGLQEEGFQYISLEVDCISVKPGTERHLSLELLHGG